MTPNELKKRVSEILRGHWKQSFAEGIIKAGGEWRENPDLIRYLTTDGARQAIYDLMLEVIGTNTDSDYWQSGVKKLSESQKRQWHERQVGRNDLRDDLRQLIKEARDV